MALSQSPRYLLPFNTLAKETLKVLGLNNKKLKVIAQSSVFEDNTGAIVVSLLPLLTPTGKFIAVKYHWFCSHIDSDRNGSKPISVDKIDGKVKPSDIFTKSKSKDS